MFKRIASAFFSLALAVGLCPSFAYADLEPGQVSFDQSQPDTNDGHDSEAWVTVDLSDYILQAGGFNHEKPAYPDARDGVLRAQSMPNVEGFNNALKEAVESWNGEETKQVDVSSYGIPADQLLAHYAGFFNRNGQYFFVRASNITFSISYDPETLIALSVPVFFDTSFTVEDKAAFEARAEEALSGVDENWNDEQKALFLHDWLVTHCEYDLTLSNHSAYHALVAGSAVCQGYSLAYNYLLSRVGIQGTIVTSTLMGHAWNLVTIGGESYFVDCTWDDPFNNQDGTDKYYYAAYCAHNHFLRNKTGDFGRTHDSTDWVDSSGNNVYANNSIGVSNAYENAYWSDCVTAIPAVDNLWAYVNSSEVGARPYKTYVYAHDYATGQDVSLATIVTGGWPVWGSSSCYLTSFASVVSNGGAFLVSTPQKLYSISIDEAPDGYVCDVDPVYSLTLGEPELGCIYGLFCDKATGECTYHLYTAPFGTDLAGMGTYDFRIYATGVSLEQETAQVEWGESLQLTAAVKPAHTTVDGVTWSSSDESIATVDSSGVVTGVSQGEADITVTTVDGGFTASCRVAVTKKNVDVPVAAEGLVYNGALQVGVAESSLYSVEGGSATDAGTYTAKAHLLDSDNYQWADAAAGEGGAEGESGEAGEQGGTNEPGASGEQGGNGESNEPGEPGESGGEGGTNESGEPEAPGGTEDREIEWSIGYKPITVKANNLSKEVDDPDPELTVTVTGLVDSQQPVYEISRQEGELVGTYPIEVTGSEIQGNYSVSYVSGTFTIAEKGSGGGQGTDPDPGGDPGGQGGSGEGGDTPGGGGSGEGGDTPGGGSGEGGDTPGGGSGEGGDTPGGGGSGEGGDTPGGEGGNGGTSGGTEPGGQGGGTTGGNTSGGGTTNNTPSGPTSPVSTKTSIHGVKLTLSWTSAVYTGKVRKPTVKAVGGLSLTPNTDYTLNYSNANSKAVGTYRVSVVGKGKCSGTSAEAIYSITKANNTLKVSPVKKTVKTGDSEKLAKAKTLSKCVKFTKKGKGAIAYLRVAKGSSKYLSIAKKSGKVTVKKGTPKGTYKIKVAVKASGNANYKPATKTITVKVTVK